VPAAPGRIEDVPMLAEHFLAKASPRMASPCSRSQTRHGSAYAHPWRATCASFSNVIERAVCAGSRGAIYPTTSGAPCRGQAAAAGSGAGPSSSNLGALGTSLRDVEELLIRKTLEATDGDKNMTQAPGDQLATSIRKLAGNSPEEPLSDLDPSIFFTPRCVVLDALRGSRANAKIRRK